MKLRLSFISPFLSIQEFINLKPTRNLNKTEQLRLILLKLEQLKCQAERINKIKRKYTKIVHSQKFGQSEYEGNVEPQYDQTESHIVISKMTFQRGTYLVTLSFFLVASPSGYRLTFGDQIVQQGYVGPLEGEPNYTHYGPDHRNPIILRKLVAIQVGEKTIAFQAEYFHEYSVLVENLIITAERLQ